MEPDYIDEMLRIVEAERRVIEAAEKWRDNLARTKNDEELVSAVDALRAARKCSTICPRAGAHDEEGGVSDCNCRRCNLSRRIEQIKAQEDNRPDLIALIDELHGDLNECEDDLEYKTSILNGSWPQAEEILSRSLERARSRRAVGDIIRLTDRASREMRERQEADDRVWALMDLVCAEWESDLQSVACFDLRMVQEAIALVKKRKAMRDPFNPFRPMPLRAPTGGGK